MKFQILLTFLFYIIFNVRVRSTSSSTIQVLIIFFYSQESNPCMKAIVGSVARAVARTTGRTAAVGSAKVAGGTGLVAAPVTVGVAARAGAGGITEVGAGANGALTRILGGSASESQISTLVAPVETGVLRTSFSESALFRGAAVETGIIRGAASKSVLSGLAGSQNAAGIAKHLDGPINGIDTSSGAFDIIDVIRKFAMKYTKNGVMVPG
jgi:hypothetical protein